MSDYKNDLTSIEDGKDKAIQTFLERKYILTYFMNNPELLKKEYNRKKFAKVCSSGIKTAGEIASEILGVGFLLKLGAKALGKYIESKGDLSDKNIDSASKEIFTLEDQKKAIKYKYNMSESEFNKKRKIYEASIEKTIIARLDVENYENKKRIDENERVVEKVKENTDKNTQNIEQLKKDNEKLQKKLQQQEEEMKKQQQYLQNIMEYVNAQKEARKDNNKRENLNFDETGLPEIEVNKQELTNVKLANQDLIQQQKTKQQKNSNSKTVAM